MKQFAARSELVEYLRAPSDYQKRIAAEACLHGLEDGFVDAVLADEPHYEIEYLAVHLLSAVRSDVHRPGSRDLELVMREAMCMWLG